MAKEVEFVGIVERQIYNTDNYKMYSISVDRDKYPDIKFTVYGTATIGGNLHSLTPGAEYMIKATEKNSNRGYMYNVINIKKTELKSSGDVYTFLQEILTFEQASELYREYPDIVNLVVSGKADGVVDLNKLHNIGEYRWGVIKDKIVENFALYDLINEFKGVLTLNMCKALYSRYPSLEKIRSEIRHNPYKCFCGLARVGFKTADSLLLELEKENVIKFDYSLRESKERCLACIMFLLEENESNGNTKMDIVELRKQVMKLTPKCSQHFVDCLNGNNNLWYSKETLEIALRSTYEVELKISGTIKSALKIYNKWNIDWKSYKNKGEFPLTDEQVSLLGKVCENQICILSGFAGSGKTATTNTLIKMLQDNNKSFKLLASTGRASKVLAAYTNQPASTIHRAYCYQPPDNWGYNEDRKIYTDIIICDEFSMVDSFLFLHLLDGIDFNKTKLLIIGDPAQACSVSAGNCLHDMINSNIVPTVQLSKIFRYGEGGLMTVATDTRNGKEFLKNLKSDFTFFGNNKDYGFKQCSDEQIINNCVGLYKKLLEKGYSIEDILVLTAQNKGNLGTISINKELQKVANPNYGKSNSLTYGETTYYVGDLVMNVVNNYRAKIYDESGIPNNETMIANGEMGIIKKIENGYAVIDFDSVMIQYYKGDFQNVILGYICSIHKAQGGGAKVVIVLTPRSHTYMNTSNLLYVGLTRTKERCFHLGDSKLINMSVHKKEEFNRKTFLSELLTN